MGKEKKSGKSTRDFRRETSADKATGNRRIDSSVEHSDSKRRLKLKKKDEMRTEIKGIGKNVLILLDAFPDPVHIVDNTLEILFINQRFLEWLKELGLDVRTAGEFLFDAFPFLSDRTKDQYEAVMRTGTALYTIGRTRLEDREVITETAKIPVKIGDQNMLVVTTIHDITDRTLAEETARSGKETLDLVFEGAELGYWVQDFVTGEIRRNDQWARMLGYEPDEVASDFATFKELVHPDDWPAVQKGIEDHESGRSPVFEVEHRMKARSNEYRWVLNWGRIVQRAEDGSPVKAAGTHLDITERKKAQEQLRIQRDTVQKYLDIAGVIIVALDITGEVEMINRKGCEILGREPEEIIGENWFQRFVPERLSEATYEAFEKLMAGELGQAEYHENPILTISGDERLVNWHNSLLRDENGNVIGTLSSGDDITERKMAEDELRKSRDRLELVVNSTNDVLFDWPDINVNKIWLSPKFFKLLGYEVSEFEPTLEKLIEMLHPDEQDGGAQWVQDMMHYKEPFEAEYRIRKKDGAYIWIQVKGGTYYNEAGEPTRMSGSVSDISRRKEMEAELIRTAQQLAEEQKGLKSANITLRHVLDSIQTDRAEYKRLICEEIEQALLPSLKKLQNKEISHDSNEIANLIENLTAILHQDTDSFSTNLANLTPREHQICDLIRENRSSKEIAKMLNVSLSTIHKHREEIRKKLGLTNKKVNLASYLRTR